MTAVIETRALEKEFVRGEHRVRALNGVSVSIDRGEFVAIVGKSGSGKSTFMNILGCLDRPNGGSYFLDGQDVAGLSADERAELRGQKIGFVFQAFNLIPRTSALENVELPLIYSEVSRAEQVRRARESLDTLGLRDRAEHHPSELSGGEQQRVAIARALVNRPKLLLADEPTGNLDTRTSLEIMAILEELNRGQGLTIVLVTHETDIAAFADRVLTFRDGEVVGDEVQASAGRRRRTAPLEEGTGP
ncbi:MAG TPA: ABC transporter ATP-binding protein [Myxococcales bacterium]|jgi:putative ABC transport system ATP-binding protein|nr:ABC transporter ATP-binding protein [Myxococcales bacterium]